MTTFEQLQSRRGGLLHLKTELFWYDGRGHDKDPGRVCLLLDVITADAARATDVEPIARTTGARLAAREAITVALLLIDGQPQWVWLAEQDIEVLNEAR
jgi:hypothetical protein